ncbi:MAG: carbamate kinase [Halobacteriales archaeon]
MPGPDDGADRRPDGGENGAGVPGATDAGDDQDTGDDRNARDVVDPVNLGDEAGGVGPPDDADLGRYQPIGSGPEFDLTVDPPQFWGTPRRKPLCMVALGGNAIRPPDSGGTFEEQRAAVAHSAEQVVEVMRAGYKVVLTHGNGPQVGALLLQQEGGEPPAQPLEVCGAMSQGQIGYMLAQQMTRALEREWRHVPVACVLTQSIIEPDDPALEDPSKPVGPYVDAAKAAEMREAGMTVERVRETGDRDYRRVVPSPEPTGIVEEVPVKRLIDQRDLVICGGGGGVPVARERGEVTGYDAVVDKDLLTGVIGHTLDANYLLILTAEDGVYLDYGTPDQRRVDRATAGEMREHLEAGEFPPGSMGPKVRAACRFVEAESRRERRAVIAALDDALAALEGEAGTVIHEAGAGDPAAPPDEPV